MGKYTFDKPCGCGKRRYTTYDNALTAAIRSSEKRGTALRVYPCPRKEKGFHLSSRTDRDTWSGE